MSRNKMEQRCHDQFIKADDAISDLWNLGCSGLRACNAEGLPRYMAALSGKSDLSITAEFQLSISGVTEIAFYISNPSKSKREQIFSFYARPNEGPDLH